MFKGTKSNLLSGIHFFRGLKTASILGYEPVAILKSTRRMKYFLYNLYNQTKHQCNTIHFDFHHRNWICMSCTMKLHLATCELIVSWKFSLHTLFVPSFLLLSGNSYSTEQKDFKYSSNHIPINFVGKGMIGKYWIKTKVWIFWMAPLKHTHTPNNSLIIITTQIYKMPFLAGAHSALQLHLQWQNTQAPQTHWIKHIMWHVTHTTRLSYIHTHTHTHTHTNQYHVGKRWVLRADLKEEADWENLISFGGVFKSIGAM